MSKEAVKDEVNPYQPPLPDGFLEDTVQGYEESLATHQRTINELRDRIRDLEAANEWLKRQLFSGSVVSVGWPEPIVVMEGADID